MTLFGVSFCGNIFLESFCLALGIRGAFEKGQLVLGKHFVFNFKEINFLQIFKLICLV